MEQDCLYCQAHFISKRASRKYCSDNCKQMAYFKRNGLILSGNSEIGNLKYEVPVAEKTESVKYPCSSNTIKDDAKPNETEIVKSSTPNNDDEILDTIINRLTNVIEGKLAESIENLKQELKVKYESPIVKPNFTINDNVVKHDNPNPQEHFTIRGTKTDSWENAQYDNKGTGNKNIFFKRNKENGQESEEEQEDRDIKMPHQIQALELTDDDDENVEPVLLDIENEKEEQEEPEIIENDLNEEPIRIQELEAQIKKLKAEIKTKTPLEKNQESEQQYKYVESKLIASIEKKYLNNKEHLFNEPMRFWSIKNIANVNWISERLCCLVASVIKLSNYNRIDKHTLLCIADAFNRLAIGNAFKNLPENYPHTELIKELCVKINHLVQCNDYSEQIRFTLSGELKSKLICVHYEMHKYFPALKFSELDFTDENKWMENKKDKNEDIENKKKDWQARYRLIKRKKLKEAA